jgi:hypothetical protein
LKSLSYALLRIRYFGQALPFIMTSTKEKQPEHGNVEHDLAIGSTYVPDLNDKAMERRIVRKIDTWILPFICISYLINFLDRVSKIAHPNLPVAVLNDNRSTLATREHSTTILHKTISSPSLV